MTTDVVLPLFPTGEEADETVRLTIKALMKGRGLTVDEAAHLTGIGRSALYSKLSDRERVPFKAGEVATMARLLRVGVTDVYAGLGGTFVPPPHPDPSVNPSAEGHGVDDVSVRRTGKYSLDHLPLVA